jgi:hypothetical protein
MCQLQGRCELQGQYGRDERSGYGICSSDDVDSVGMDAVAYNDPRSQEINVTITIQQMDRPRMLCFCCYRAPQPNVTSTPHRVKTPKTFNLDTLTPFSSTRSCCSSTSVQLLILSSPALAAFIFFLSSPSLIVSSLEVISSRVCLLLYSSTLPQALHACPWLSSPSPSAFPRSPEQHSPASLVGRLHVFPCPLLSLCCNLHSSTFHRPHYFHGSHVTASPSANLVWRILVPYIPSMSMMAIGHSLLY